MGAVSADRLAEVWASPGRAGAGIIVGAHGVLTARHLVAGAPTGAGDRVLARAVRAGDSTAPWAPMTVGWQSAEWDVALLTLDHEDPEAGNWVSPTSETPAVVRLGVAPEKDCVATGFPDFTVQRGAPARPAGTVRQPEQVTGTVLPAGQSKRPVDPERQLPRRWVPLDVATSTADEQRGWLGMSGAAVTLPDPDGRLIGLIAAAERGHQNRRLYLVPLADVIGNEAELEAELRAVAVGTVVQVREAPRMCAALDGVTLGADGLPLRVRELDDLGAFGVKAADLPGEPTYLDYVGRDDDQILRAAIARTVAERRMLLLVGGSAAGKSRSLAEAVRATLPDHRLLCPHPKQLTDLAGLPLRDLRPAVVWLDDVQHYAHDGLRETLRRLLAGGLSIAATVRRAELDRLTPAGDVRNAVGEALSDKNLVERIDWRLKWSDEERERMAERVHHGALLRATAKGVALGAYVVAGPQLVDRLTSARADDERPVRRLLVRVVLDWYRSGITEPIPLEVTTRLLAEVAGEGEQLDDAEIADALAWAEEGVIGSGRQTRQSLVSRVVSANALAIHDYVLDHDQQSDNRTVPAPVLAAALELAPDGFSRYMIGVTAYIQNEDALARTALTPLAKAGDPYAMLALGSSVARRDLRAGRSWLRRALDAAGPDLVPMIQASMGAVLMSSGDPDGARPILLAALESGDPRAKPLAEANLGGLLVNQGELDQARALLEAAVDSGDPDAVPLAQANLGGLLVEQGESPRARSLLQAAMDSRHHAVLPLAQANLGAVLVDEGDYAGARPLLDAAIASGQLPAAALAQVNLCPVLLEQGEPERALSVLESAVASGSPPAASLAQLKLGVLLAASGQRKRGRRLLRAAIDSGRPSVVPLARVNLAEVMVDDGELAEAKDLLRAVIDAAEPEVLPIAQARLGALLLNAGDLDGARSLLEAAIASGHADVVPMAQVTMATVLGDQGESEQARPLLEAAIASGDSYAGPMAQMKLGALLLNAGDLDRGRRLTEAAITSGHPDAVPLAQLNMAISLEDQGEPDKARPLLEAAIASGDPEARPAAQVNLANMLADDGDLAGARRLLEAAVTADQRDVTPIAQASLGGVLISLGKWRKARPLLEAALASGNPDAVPVARANLELISAGRDKPQRRGWFRRRASSAARGDSVGRS